MTAQDAPGRDDSGDWAGSGYPELPPDPSADELRLAAGCDRLRGHVGDLAQELADYANAVRPGPDAGLALRTAGRLRKILEDM